MVTTRGGHLSPLEHTRITNRTNSALAVAGHRATARLVAPG
jgi:hypothetical protein